MQPRCPGFTSTILGTGERSALSSPALGSSWKQEACREAYDLENCPIHSGKVDVLGGFFLGVLYMGFSAEASAHRKLQELPHQDGQVLSLLCCLGGVSVSLGWERALSRQELVVSFSFHLGKQQRGRQWSDWGLASLQRRVLKPQQAW